MALSIVALPLTYEKTLFSDETSVAVLLVTDPERPSGLDPEYLYRRFGFNRSEARLATALAQGKDLRRSASMAGVTYETARWYLKSMFQKTCTRRQSELIGLLLTELAAMLSADDSF